MADWTLSTATVFRPYRSLHGSPIIKYFQESTCASSQTIHLGQVVTTDTNVTTGGDRLVIAPSSGGNGANLMQVAIISLVGVAAMGSTSDGTTTGLSVHTNKQLPVWVADDETEFLGYLKGSGPAASSLIGLDKAIIYDTTLATYFIDSTNSTAALVAVHITDIPDYAVGDTNGPVVFRFLSSNVSPSV